MQSRISGIGLSGIARKVLELHATRLERRCHRAAGRRHLQAAPRGGEAHAFDGDADPHAAERGRHRQLPDLPALRRGGAQAAAGRAARPAGFPHRGRTPISVDEVESITEIRKRLVAPGISLGALSPEAHETLSIAMNRIGARIGQRRGRRGPGARQAARQRRQRVLGDQADRLGPLRRDRGIPEQLPRDRDQGGAGRQARRGRAAARLQGLRPDRQAAPLRRRA